jgi:ABC-2 type transport system permease protein
MGAAVRTTLAYRGNLLNIMLGSVALQGAQLLFIGVILTRFQEIGGWSFQEIALLFAMRLCAHAACTIPFGQHAAIDFLVNEGEYDRFLLRPASPFLQLITFRFNAGSLGDLVLGLAALGVAIAIGPVEWTPLLVLLLIGAIIAGGLVEAGVEIFLSGLSFRMRATYTLKVTVDNTFSDFGAYPLTIFGQVGGLLLTFLLPLAFIAYLPATAILGRTDELVVPAWMAWSSLVVGPLVFLGGVRFFRHQSRHYDSPAG